MQFVDGVRSPNQGAAVLDFRPPASASVPPPTLLPNPTRLISDIRPPQAVPALTLPAQVMEVPATTEAQRSPRNWIIAGVTLSLVLVGSLSLYRFRQQPQPTRASSASSTAKAPAVTTPTAPESKVIEPTPTQQAEAALAAQTLALKGLIDQFALGVGAPAGIVVKDLKTGATAGSNQDKVFTSASLYKLFVAHAILKQIDAGTLSLGSPTKGVNRTIQDCLNVMITVSDNACGEAMGAMLGWEKYNATLQTLGFTHTKFADNMQTSAGDVALLYERLYNGTLLSPNSTTRFLNLLKAQRINNRLPQGLPGGTVIAHKTGDVLGFVHDAGIVYGPTTDYIVVMTSGPWKSVLNAPPKFAELSSLLYSQLK